MKYNFEKYCKDYENIENYEKALADNFKGWDCHHRLETHNSDGERRLIDITQKELKALGMYYNRPAEELIFLTTSEHRKLHKCSEEAKKKMSESRKGKHLSEETRKKLSEANKGKQKSEETKNKLSTANKGEKNPMYGKKHSDAAKKKISEKAKGNIKTKGTRWFNNGKISKRAKECPEGFIPGRIKKP